MSEQIQLTINQGQPPSNDKGYNRLFEENLPLGHAVSFINDNCTWLNMRGLSMVSFHLV